MKFAFSLLPILAAALRFVEAGPVEAEGLTKRAPAEVRKIFCDGDAYVCTAHLHYDDGRWVAQWSTAVFHRDLFGYVSSDKQMTTMAPVEVTHLECDGDTYKCFARLKYDDGRWFAEWHTKVFYEPETLFGQEFESAVAPVPVRKLHCDGDSYKCRAKLKYGDGHWVAEWETDVFHL